MIKNASNLYSFAIQDQLSNGVTGQTPSVFVRQDNGSFAAASGSVTEVDATNYPGLYQITLTAAECNCDVLTIAVSLPDGQEPAILDVAYPVTTGGATPAEIWGYAGGRTVDNTIPTVNEIWGRQAGDTTSRTLTSSPTDISSLATADALSSVADNVGAVKAKTDNLPANPAAVGSAMTLTSETIASVKDGLATIAATDALAGGLDTLANYGDAHWSTADLSDVSTFDPSTDAVTLTDAYDAAKTASQLTTSDLSALATSAELTAASASLTTLINLLLSGLYHWQVNDTIMTVYNASDVAIGAYTLTKDTTGNITAVTPIVQQSENNEG